MSNNHPGRLRKAEEILNKVHSDVGREEDDPTARGLQHRSLQHIDAALKATKRALVQTAWPKHGGVGPALP